MNNFNEIEKEFEKKFDDITHFGCPSTPDVPCETLRHDIKAFFRQKWEEREKELVKKAQEIVASEMDKTELLTNGEFVACDNLAIGIIKRLSLLNKEI